MEKPALALPSGSKHTALNQTAREGLPCAGCWLHTWRAGDILYFALGSKMTCFPKKRTWGRKSDLIQVFLCVRKIQESYEIFWDCSLPRSTTILWCKHTHIHTQTHTYAHTHGSVYTLLCSLLENGVALPMKLLYFTAFAPLRAGCREAKARD